MIFYFLQKEIKMNFGQNKDADREVLQRIDDDSKLLEMCSMNSYFNNLCDDTFFYNRLLLNYPKTIPFRHYNMNWKKYYLSVTNYIRKLKEEFNFEFTKNTKGTPIVYYDLIKKIKIPEFLLERAAGLGLIDLVKYVISQEEERPFLRNAFKAAVKLNDREIIDYFINELASDDWNKGLQYSAKNNNKELIDFFLQKGANINYGMRGAAQGGNVELFKWFVSQGANDWDHALLGATESGNEYLVNFIINEMTKNNMIINWANALYKATQYGHLNLLEYYISRNNFSRDTLSVAMGEDIQASNVEEILKYLISKGANNFEYALKKAQQYQNPKMIKFFRNYNQTKEKKEK